MPEITQYERIKKSHWLAGLEPRMQNDVLFCVMYADSFGHGALDHNRMCLVADMAEMLTAAEEQSARR